MPWSPEFVDAISQDTVTPLFLLESLQIGTFNPTSTPMMLSSFYVSGYTNCLTREGSSVTYGTLTPGTWDRSYGTLSLGISAHEDLRKTVARGMAVQLKVGVPGWGVSRFEPVWIGVVRNLRWLSGRWVLDCVELAGALQNRFSDVTDEQNLFFNLPAETKLAADYDPATDDPATGFQVLDTTGFEANDAAFYTARITPSGDNAYYVTADTLTVDVFSGSAAGAFDSPLDHHKNPGIGTPAAAVTDDPVEAIAWIRTHPLRFAQQVLVSTGLGTNGPQDVLPASWAFGFDSGLVASADISAFVDLVQPSGSVHWDFLVDHSQSDGQSWLTEQLRPGGFFLSTHQGKLTVRAVLAYSGRQTPGSVSVSDDDLVDIPEYQTWDDQSPVEYRQVRVLGYNGQDPSAFREQHFATRPTRTSRRRDLVQAFSDVSAGWTDEVSSRLGPYDTRVPERLTLELAGWKAAVASIGDFVFLTTNFLAERTQVLNGSPESLFRGTACLMVGGGPDWFGSSCRIEVLVVPPYATLE